MDLGADTPDDPLEAQLVRAALGMPFAALRRLLELGMDPAALGRLTGEGLLGLARVEVLKGGLFQFDPGGEQRLILGVCEPCGRGWGPAAHEERVLVDLVAISSADPNAWALRCGYAAVLGEDALEEADAAVCAERPAMVRLFGRPLDWLIAGGAPGSICVLDWTAAALARLRGLGSKVTLACDDAAAAERLRGVLVHGGLPKVVAAGTVGERIRRAA